MNNINYLYITEFNLVDIIKIIIITNYYNYRNTKNLQQNALKTTVKKCYKCHYKTSEKSL